MSPLSLLLHIGAIIAAAKDLEQAVGDALKGDWKGTEKELEQVLQDFLNLVSDGLIQIPGVSGDQLKGIVGQVSQELSPAAAPAIAAAAPVAQIEPHDDPAVVAARAALAAKNAQAK